MVVCSLGGKLYKEWSGESKGGLTYGAQVQAVPSLLYFSTWLSLSVSSGSQHARCPIASILRCCQSSTVGSWLNEQSHLRSWETLVTLRWRWLEVATSSRSTCGRGITHLCCGTGIETNHLLTFCWPLPSDRRWCVEESYHFSIIYLCCGTGITYYPMLWPSCNMLTRA